MIYVWIKKKIMANKRHEKIFPSKLARAKKTGRPPKELWPDQIEELAAIQCTMEEMAAVLGCDRATIEIDPLLMERVKKGRERGKSELRKAQFSNATKYNSNTMQIWLGKNYLNQCENPSTTLAQAQGAFTDWSRAMLEDSANNPAAPAKAPEDKRESE